MHELRKEFDDLGILVEEDAQPMQDELRVRQAQLIGWLEGIFHLTWLTIADRC